VLSIWGIFLRKLALSGSVPRMKKGDASFLSEASFRYLFGASEQEIRHRYHSVGMLPREIPDNPRRPSNRARCTRTYIPRAGSPEPVLFRLAERGHRLPSPPIDENSDNEGAPDDRSPGNGDIDQQVTQLWRQFLVDVLNKAPNPKKNGSDSYCKLTPAERQSVDEEVYRSTDLSEVWNACQWRLAKEQEWDRAFSHLFPPVGHLTRAAVQNYRQCRYYQTWKAIATGGDRAAAEAIRRAIRTRVRSFGWLPDAAQDKMWPTKAMHAGGRFKRYPPGSTGPAPQILLRKNPKF
jgi:hypothetical protein